MTEQQFEHERDLIRQARLAVLKAFLKKLNTAMRALRPRDAAWSEVTGGIKMVVDQLRFEYRAASPGLAAPSVEDTPDGQLQPANAADPFSSIRLKLHRPTGT